jgi:hypothetical protein
MDDIGVGVPVGLPEASAADLADEVLKHASITRGEGLRHARREIAKDRNATLRVILTLLKVLIIPRTEEILTHNPEFGIKPECGPGCNACCYQSVEVSIPEAILVSIQVADPMDPRRAVILETASATTDVGPAARARMGIPCPLLVDGKCSVYEDRPLLCRATLSPCAKACYDVMAGKEGAALQIYGGPQFFAVGDKDALRGICKDLSLQFDRVELVQTVAAILRDPTTVVRWALGEHVFRPLPTNVPVPA